jgi:hypothetical protein
MSSQISSEEKKKKQREATKRWRKNNRDKINANRREWRNRNIEKCRKKARAKYRELAKNPEYLKEQREWFREYSKNNRDVINQTFKRCYEKNKEKILAQQAEYREKNRQWINEKARLRRLKSKLLKK